MTFLNSSPSIPTLTFAGDPIQYQSVSWDQLTHLVFKVAQDIFRDSASFDQVITLSKGGWPMTRALVDFLGNPKVASIGVESYVGIAERAKEFHLYQDIEVPAAVEHILVFDDVADTGESLDFVCRLLRQKGVKKITTATVFYKPHSKVVPTYFAASTESWIIFPYELRETLAALTPKWRAQGCQDTQIITRFKQLGFDTTMTQWLLETHFPQ